MTEKDMTEKKGMLMPPDGFRTDANPRGLSRGDVVYVTGDRLSCTGNERWPNRPAVIVSASVSKFNTVQVVYLSHALKTGRYNLNVTDCTGRTVRACCDQAHCVDYSRIGNYLYHICDAEMYGISKALASLMGICVDNHAQDIQEYRARKEKGSMKYMHGGNNARYVMAEGRCHGRLAMEG